MANLLTSRTIKCSIFTNVQQTLRTSLKNALIFYRCTKTGFPCFSPVTEEGVANPKEILVCVSNYFGLADLPQACGKAVAMAVPTYLEHLRGEDARKKARNILVKAGNVGLGFPSVIFSQKLSLYLK